MGKHRKRADHQRPHRAGEAHAPVRRDAPSVPAPPYVPMPKPSRQTWWPIVGALVVILIALSAVVGAAISRGGDPPIPRPGLSAPPR